MDYSNNNWIKNHIIINKMKNNKRTIKSSILNALVFIILLINTNLLINTKTGCINTGIIVSSVLMIGISFLVQLIDSIE